MGIPNPEEYTITPHATERIKQRFGQTKDTLSDWANRLLKECVFVKREESGRDRYRYQDIAIILDVKKRQVITMFPDPQDAIKLEKKPLNPELQTSVNKMVDDFLKFKRHETADAVYLMGTDIEKAISDFYVNSTEDNLDELKIVLNKIKDTLSKYDMFVSETKLLTGKAGR
ncbi:hypothetical protein [Ligilactobacillus murinus]|uniref:Uncharacterized protein n=1 Tax=Ligilactobacillus murinus TaxID=1622 RepID=A0A4Q2AX15_9LACO|nr:hypothetical protein [Ligilactobacillus murinus]NBH84684.1 hypothetical protein [Lachnospiraceae bacterium]MBX9013325.1 hypothetical protein [Ligilactobacillus murinus]MCR1896264.1 hypothetical protein [Ligilactobacillus murinus]NBH40227.1 hypothetical protein [Ligilactobacillus murinus]RII81436.1 hypothetical protein D1870_01140 [Ligilactobacillus murinus]